GLAAVTGPDGHGGEQVDHVDLAAQESFDDLSPAAEQARLLYLQALLLKQFVVMRNQKGGGIRDGNIADAHRAIRLCRKRLPMRMQQWEGARRREHGG